MTPTPPHRKLYVSQQKFLADFPLTGSLSLSSGHRFSSCVRHRRAKLCLLAYLRRTIAKSLLPETPAAEFFLALIV
jgi:hypothetical protein